MLIIGPSGSRKTNALINLIQQDNGNLVDQIYLYAKNLDEPKYQFLIEKLEYSSTMDDVYNKIDDYNSKIKRKVLIVLNDMIADIMTNKKSQATIKELFIRYRKLNISLVFISQSYFSVPKEIRLNSTHYLIMRIHNRRELQQIAIDHSADINYKDFLKIYRNCTKGP